MLRIGVLLNTDAIPSWAYEMLRRIEGGTYAKIVVLVKNDAPALHERSLWQKVRANSSRLLYAAHDRAERFLFSVSPDAFLTKPVSQLLPNVPIVPVQPVQTKFSDSLTDEDITRIESYQVDVFIRLGFRILRGKILRSARFGVWSYHHGDNRVNRGGPPGFWEVLLGWPETGSVLQILTEDLDGGQVLYRSFSQTDHVSVLRNKNNFYWKSVAFLPRMLEQLHTLGGQQFMALVERNNGAPCFYSSRLFVVPGNLEMAQLLWRHAWRFARKKIRDFFYFDQWYLMYGVARAEGVSSSVWRFKEIVPPKDRFWADPFLLHRDGRYYVFIEEYCYATKKGHIAYFILDESGNRTEPKMILDRPYHLSYPFLFEYRGDTYMIPESAQNRTIELYRCVEFPEKWELVKLLMKDIYAVDATLHQADGLWWLFVNVREYDGASVLDELFLFFSTDPLSDEWTPHSANPVVSDVKSARPAGRIFELGGRLYRPSQDNSRNYGYAIRINRIETLTPTEYREVFITGVAPTWDPAVIGVHTLNFEGSMTLLDGRKRRRKYLG